MCFGWLLRWYAPSPVISPLWKMSLHELTRIRTVEFFITAKDIGGDNVAFACMFFDTSERQTIYLTQWQKDVDGTILFRTTLASDETLVSELFQDGTIMHRTLNDISFEDVQESLERFALLAIENATLHEKMGVLCDFLCETN
jgi:hypothetical protein